jgi:hypothetical protein
MDEQKKKFFVLAMLAVGVIGLVVILVQVPPLQIIRTFHDAQPFPAVMFLACSAAVMLTFSFRWHLILRALGHNVPVWSLFKYRVSAYGISAMTPTAKVGGEPVRMMLLARHNVPSMKRVTSVITDKLVEISTNIVFFLVGLVLVLLKLALPLKTEVFIMVMMAVLIGLLFLFYYHLFTERFFFSKVFRFFRLHKSQKLQLLEFRIKEMERVMIDYHMRNRKNFYTVIIISSLGWIFTLGELYFAVKLLGIAHVSISQLFIILVFIGLAFLIPIPLAVGSLEALQISIFAMMSFASSASAVAMSFLIRALDVFWIFLAIIFLSSFRLSIVKVFTRSLKTVDEELTEVKLKATGESVSIKRRYNKILEPRKPTKVEVWVAEQKRKGEEEREHKRKLEQERARKEHLFSNLGKKR